MDDLLLAEKPTDWSKGCFLILILWLIASVTGWLVLYQTSQQAIEKTQVLDIKISDLQNQMGGIQKQLNELLMQTSSS